MRVALTGRPKNARQGRAKPVGLRGMGGGKARERKTAQRPFSCQFRGSAGSAP